MCVVNHEVIDRQHIGTDVVHVQWTMKWLTVYRQNTRGACPINREATDSVLVCGARDSPSETNFFVLL